VSLLSSSDEDDAFGVGRPFARIDRGVSRQCRNTGELLAVAENMTGRTQ
jgi:hypothetical protein